MVVKFQHPHHVHSFIRNTCTPAYSCNYMSVSDITDGPGPVKVYAVQVDWPVTANQCHGYTVQFRTRGGHFSLFDNVKSKALLSASRLILKKTREKERERAAVVERARK